jgi:hypothetical protein
MVELQNNLFSSADTQCRVVNGIIQDFKHKFPQRQGIENEVCTFYSLHNCFTELLGINIGLNSKGTFPPTLETSCNVGH